MGGQTSGGEQPPLRARLLGSFELAVGERLIPDEAWKRRHARSLLLLLLATPGHRLPRDRVLDLLWPDTPPADALNALYVALHALRRLLEPDLTRGRASAYVDVAGDAVRLRPEAIAWIDVEAFEATLTQAATAPPPRRLALLREAIALYGGDLLADEPYLDWPIARREQLRAACRRAVLELAERETAEGHPLDVVPLVERLLAADPLDEVALRLLMQTLAAAGRPEDALRHYERSVDLLRAELGSEPSDETREVAQTIRSAPARSGRPAVPARQRFDNLPAAPTPLVGRTRELDDLQTLLLREAIRLVTLTGPGGVGKTRLALEAATQAAEEFADGVGFVALAAIHDPALVVPTIAHTLGVEIGAGLPVAVALAQALRGRELLLLLDNLEQVIESAAEIADLLTACPRLTVLATSREPLHLRAEHEFPLEPLPAPAVDRLPAATTIGRYPAVTLFVERARAVRPDFALTAENAAAVGTLCARLDGLPLAIELAAARCRQRTPAELVTALTDRFALLAGGFRDLPPRQRTMRTTIGWSYDLLTPEERALFRALAVFEGGFTLDGAAAVATATVDVDAGVISLAEKNLVRRQPMAGQAERYEMLETIREFGLAELAAHCEIERARCAHAAWCLALAERAAAEVTGPNQAIWLERLDQEHANLRAALAWLIATGSPDAAALRLGAALWRFWWSRGYGREGVGWLERALAQADAGADPTAAPAGALVARADAIQALAELYEALGNFDASARWFAQALELREALGDDAGVAEVLNGLGLAARWQGRLDRAEELHIRALAIVRRLDARREIASALNNLGGVAYFRGDAEQAERYWEEGLAIVRALGDHRSVGALLGNLGAVVLMRGDPVRATEIHEEAVALARSLGDAQAITHALVNLGGALYERADYPRAAAIFAEALQRAREGGESATEATILYDLGKLAEVEGDPAQAARHFAGSLRLFAQIGSPGGIAACLEQLGTLAIKRDRHDAGVRLVAAAAVIREATGIARETVDHGECERWLAAARDTLGEAGYAEVWAGGARLSQEEAVAAALALHAAV